MKRNLKRVPVLFFCCAALMCALMGLNAQNSAFSRITVTFYGDAMTSKGFTWYTGSQIKGSQLMVAPYSPQGPDWGAASVYEGTSGMPANSSGELWHKAVADNLAPGSKYHFRVGDSAGDIWSDAGTFETAGYTTGGFTFICLTDTQSATLSQSQLAAGTIRKALETAGDAKFIIHSGDVVDTGSNEQEWINMLDQSAGSLMRTTIAPAAGNHDWAQYSFIEHFNLDHPEGSDVKRGAYYSFTYQGVHFVTLNTNESSSEYADATPKQIEWLKSDVAAAKAQGADRFVVNLHKGMYTMGPYSSAGDVIGKNGQRAKVAPIFEQLGVSLVLQGHDHFACRTRPLKGGEYDPQGITYINTNAAGPKVYSADSGLSQSYLSRFAYYNKKTPQYGRYQNFAVIRVDSDLNFTGTLYEIDQKAASKEPYAVDSFYLPNMQGPMPFYDVTPSHWGYEDIKKAYASNLMAGTSTGYFAPNGVMSRAMLAMVLHRMDGEPSAHSSAFSDVKPGDWHYEAVGWAYESGYITGLGGGSFAPNASLTREQMAAVIHRYIGGESGPMQLAHGQADAQASFFDEGEISSYARAAVIWGLENGIFKGRANGLFDPQGQVTRAEAAVVLSRALELKR